MSRTGYPEVGHSGLTLLISLSILRLQFCSPRLVLDVRLGTRVPWQSYR